MPSTTDTPELTWRRTRRHRPSGRIDSYESLLLAGRKVDRRTSEAQLFKAFEDRLHQELGGRAGLSTAQLHGWQSRAL